jgi:hypothetical protein
MWVLGYFAKVMIVDELFGIATAKIIKIIQF